MIDIITIEPFLQYGLLGVIAYIYIRITNKLFDKQSEQFQLLIDNLVNQNDDSDDVESAISTLIQTVNNQTKFLSQLINDLSVKLTSEISIKNDLLKLFLEIEDRSNKRDIEFGNVLNEYKMLLIEMKTNCGFSTSRKKIGTLLIEKKLITQQQLDEALQEQEQISIITLEKKN